MSDETRTRELLTLAVRPLAEVTPPPGVELIRRGRQRRTHRRVAAAGGAALAAAVVVSVPIVLVTRGSETSTPASYPTTGPGTVSSLANAQWHEINDDEPPIPTRNSPVAAWTGSEALFWGGLRPEGFRADGAAYNPVTDTWRKLERSPLTARRDAAAVWTGEELFIWGGYGDVPFSGFGQHWTPGELGDGATYNPVTNEWRRLPLPVREQADRGSSPLLPETVGAQALWTGREVVIVGGTAATASRGHAREVAAYDPKTQTWRPLPPIPTSADRTIAEVTSVAAGREVFVWVEWYVRHERAVDGGTRVTGDAGVEMYRLDVDAQTWSSFPPDDVHPEGVNQAFWTGRELVIPGAGPWDVPWASGPFRTLPPVWPGYRYDPTADLWDAIADPPFGNQGAPSVWTGASLISRGDDLPDPDQEQHTVGAWDPASDKWVTLPEPPVHIGETATVVFAGDRLVIWGGIPSRDGNVFPGMDLVGLVLGP